MDSSTQLKWALVLIVVATMAAAVTLQVLHQDASKAWEGFSGALGGLLGLHVAPPSQ